MQMVKKVIVLGGGSAGFMAAITLKLKVAGIQVVVVRSKEIGIIGVGEGSTVALTRFLHQYLAIGNKKFMEVAQPTWKLGLRFLWGPRPQFHYGFGPGMDAQLDALPKSVGYYCEEDVEYPDLICAMMAHDRVFERAGAGIRFHDAVSYHFENEKYVRFLEEYAAAIGVSIRDDTVSEVKQDETGVAALVLASGQTESADLYVDSSGFASLLLGRTLGEPFVSFKQSLFCDRAVVGGWERNDEPIRPYTTCETMESGWCWQIEHEHRINRGYVYCSDFISDEEAEREFRQKNPKLGPTRVVRFVSGRYRRNWVKNVVAIGNASGFVEPLEATALGVIGMQSRLLADSLRDCDRQPGERIAGEYNQFHARNWDGIRDFIAIHYKYNTRLSTPFWRHCQETTEIGGAERIVEYYRENGPSKLWSPTLFEPFDTFGPAGYFTLLVGQKVPYRRTYEPAERERAFWKSRQHQLREQALRALSVRQALEIIRSPKWKWVPPTPSKGGAFAPAV